MFKNILLTVLVLCGLQTQVHAARFTDYGTISHKNDIGLFDFNVYQESKVNIWELSNDDYRISLFNDTGLIASNDDNRRNWFYDVYSDSISSGKRYRGQNWLDASLLSYSLLGNYTAVVSYWTNAGELGESLNDAFNIAFGSTRNKFVGDYQLNIKGQYVTEGHKKVSTVPAPGALLLLLSGLPGIFYISKSKNRLSKINIVD